MQIAGGGGGPYIPLPNNVVETPVGKQPVVQAPATMSPFQQRFPILGGLAQGAGRMLQNADPQRLQAFGSVLRGMGAGGLAGSAQGLGRPGALAGMAAGANQGLNEYLASQPQSNPEVEAIIAAGREAGVSPELLIAASGGNSDALGAVVDALQPQDQGYMPLTGDQVQELNQQGIALDPSRAYQINLDTGQITTIGGQATGFSVEIGPDGSVSFRQGALEELNQSQVTGLTYSGRMAQADEIISANEGEGTNFWSRVGTVIAGDNGLLNLLINPNYSDEYRSLLQAERNFINAVLRRESGAVINPSEFANARLQYMPQPGDDADTLAQKAANRRLATMLMGQGVTPGFDPYATYQQYLADGNAPLPVPDNAGLRGELRESEGNVQLGDSRTIDGQTITAVENGWLFEDGVVRRWTGTEWVEVD